MATDNIRNGITGIVSSADYTTTGQFRIGFVGASGWETVTGPTVRPDGVLAGCPNTGDPAKVYGVGDVAIVEAGAATTKGALCTADASGRGVDTSAGTDEIVGRFLEAASGAGAQVRVYVTLSGTAA